MVKNLIGLWIALWTSFWDRWYSFTKKCPKIITRVIDHCDQRYNTVGDYYYTCNGTLLISVSNMGDWRSEYLIMLHEITEIEECFRLGISVRDIDKFDLEFDAKRQPGDTSEPGDNPNCPYYPCHQLASKEEREGCKRLGLSWEDHDGAVARIMDKRSHEEMDDH